MDLILILYKRFKINSRLLKFHKNANFTSILCT